MSFNYEYQQPDGNNQYGSLYGSNSPAAAGGSYQLGAHAAYNSLSYGSSGSQSSGSLGGTTQQSSLQNTQYPSGYGGQQTLDSNYSAYPSGSTPATAGTNAYSGLATAQAAMAQAAASMAAGYPLGQSMYYSPGISTGSAASYGGIQSSSPIHPSQSITQDYTCGTGYTSGLRSSAGGMEGYAPYPSSDASSELRESSSPYGSTYPSNSDDGVSSSSTAYGAIAGMPVPLGSSGGFAALFR